MSKNKAKTNIKTASSENFLTTTNLLIALGGLLVAILGVIYARGQYLISEQSTQTKAVIRYVRPFGGRDIEIQKDYMCQSKKGEIHWTLETFGFFDVSNLGDKSLSLLEIYINGMYGENPIHPNINLWFQGGYFGNSENFDEWLGDQAEIWHKLGSDTSAYEFSRPPIIILAGETRRLVQNIEVHAIINPSMTLKSATEFLRNIDIENSQRFEFADNTIIDVDYALWGEWLFGFNSPTNIQDCGY